MDKNITQKLLQNAITKALVVHIPILLLQWSYQLKSSFHKSFDFPILGMIITFLLIYTQHTFHKFEIENSENLLVITLLMMAILQTVLNQYILLFMTNAFLSLCFCLLGASFYFKKIKPQAYSRQSLVIYCIGLSLIGTMTCSLFTNINLLFMQNIFLASVHATFIAYFIGVKIGEKWEGVMSKKIKYSESEMLNSVFSQYINVLVGLNGTIIFLVFMAGYLNEHS